MQPSAAPPAARQYDGAYVGATTLTRGGGYVCGVPDLPRKLVVRDGQFEYPFQQQPPSLTTFVPVHIAANGRFDRSTSYYEYTDGFRHTFSIHWLTVRGRIAGDTLVANESDARCARRSVLRRH